VIDEQPAGTSRWQAAVALLASGLIYLALPARLRLGPSWLILLFVVILLIPLFVAHVRGYPRLTYWTGRIVTLVVTMAVALSAGLLVDRIPGSQTAGSNLLRDAALLWGSNILAFALWYWEIDGGGPVRRRLGSYVSGDFVFPQLQQDPKHGAERWLPDFLDYLFLAFNTSTAFSPTDTLVLSRRAKALMMAQSVISLVIIGVLAARAINTLQ
jgi:hypothetical protein